MPTPMGTTMARGSHGVSSSSSSLCFLLSPPYTHTHSKGKCQTTFPGPHSSWNSVPCDDGPVSGWPGKPEVTGVGVRCMVGVELGRSFRRHVSPVTWREQQRARAILSSPLLSQPRTKKQDTRAFTDGHSSGKGWKGGGADFHRGRPVGRTAASPSLA